MSPAKSSADDLTPDHDVDGVAGSGLRDHAAAKELMRLLTVMARLRDPDEGCPWDHAQNYATIAPYTIEEAYEVADAVARGDKADLRDEVGDLLFQVIYYARLAQEEDLFDFADIARHAADKMIDRHPNVFGDAKTPDARAQAEAWENRKRAERTNNNKGKPASELDGVAKALPALIRADKLSRRAARAGFEWKTLEDVWGKLREEETELRQAADQDQQRAEFGDLLFSLVNIGRWMDIDPEVALRQANDKFERRFRALESCLSAQGRRLEECDLSQLEAIWQQVKKQIDRGAAAKKFRSKPS